MYLYNIIINGAYFRKLPDYTDLIEHIYNISEEAMQISVALPFCNRLEQLALQNNNITSSGAIAVVQAACSCSSLQGLDLTGKVSGAEVC